MHSFEAFRLFIGWVKATWLQMLPCCSTAVCAKHAYHFRFYTDFYIEKFKLCHSCLVYALGHGDDFSCAFLGPVSRGGARVSEATPLPDPLLPVGGREALELPRAEVRGGVQRSLQDMKGVPGKDRK